MEAEARRRRAQIVAYKDLLSTEYNVAEAVLSGARYVKIASLPIAVLDLEAQDVNGYLATLSAATRKDIRRKLKTADAVRVERRSNIDDIADKIEALYQSTRASSSVDYDAFEQLPEGYFRSVSENLKDRVLFILYWVGDELAAFNMLLLEPDRAIDKFLGMRYPLARDHNLYVVSWIENIRFAWRPAAAACKRANRVWLEAAHGEPIGALNAAGEAPEPGCELRDPLGGAVCGI